MKYFIKIILIFCIFFITLVLNAANAVHTTDNSYIAKKHIIITSLEQNNVSDIISVKENNTISAITQKIDNIYNTVRDFDNNSILNKVSQTEKILTYIYMQSFLEQKDKIRFSSILTEIKPHAP